MGCLNDLKFTFFDTDLIDAIKPVVISVLDSIITSMKAVSNITDVDTVWKTVLVNLMKEADALYSATTKPLIDSATSVTSYFSDMATICDSANYITNGVKSFSDTLQQPSIMLHKQIYNLHKDLELKKMKKKILQDQIRQLEEAKKDIEQW